MIADGVAIIKVGSSIEDVATAAEQFIGKPLEALRGEAQEVLEGHLRAILGSMTVEEVYRNRDRFAQEVQGVAARDLKKWACKLFHSPSKMCVISTDIWMRLVSRELPL